MPRIPYFAGWSALLLSGGAFLIFGHILDPAPSPDHLHPAPTEHVLDADAERRHKESRKAWIESMHRTAEHDDWRAIEKANGAARQAERNRAAGKLSMAQWAEIGSRNLAGRMHCAALSDGGDSLVGGSSLGGLWKADPHGNGWRPLGDNLYGGVHGVAVSESGGEVITAITDGGLVHYTEDRGNTWNVPAGIPATLTECTRVVSDPANPGHVYFALRQSGTSGKVFFSSDGGRSYGLILRLTSANGDIWTDRAGGGVLYVQKGLQTLRTFDQGASWDTLGMIPAASESGIVLAGSEAGAPALYAAARVGSQWKLYRSANAGSTWTYKSDINDFWETLESSIVNENMVYFGGVECWRSTNGGSSFAKINGWGEYYGSPATKLHADLPGMNAVWDDGQEILYIATDGGLYRSDDQGASVANISLVNLGVSQYYTTLTTINDPDLILAGAQDQGYQRTNGNLVGTLHDFDQLISGDYAHLTSWNGGHGRVYSVYPGFMLIQQGENIPTLYTADFPPGESYPWLPYVQAAPRNPNAVYFCARYLYRYDKTGPGTWVPTQLAHDFSNGGGEFLSAIAFSPVDTTRWVGVTNTGTIWYSSDRAGTWSESANNGPSQMYLYGTAIAASPHDADEFFLGGSGYSSPGVFRSQDGGVSWQAESAGLPATMVYELAYEKTGSGFVYAATEAGPYQFDPSTETWSAIAGGEAPLTTYWCVEAVPAAGVMRFGTYGRGIWDFDYSVATTIAGGPAPVRQLALTNAPNPFNPRTTVRFTLDRPGRASLRIFTPAGRLVRTLADGHCAGGDHAIEWNGQNDAGHDVASGVYFARLESDGEAAKRRLILVR